MAKRFTESMKWEDSWFRKLPPVSKLFWLFIVDKCDIAGFWETDWELASFYIGATIDETILKDFDGRLKIMDDGKIWIVKFIEFQYGKLNPAVNLHRSVISILEKKGLLKKVKGSLTLTEGFKKGSRRVQEGLDKSSGTLKVKVKDKVKLKDQENTVIKTNNIETKTEEENTVKKKEEKEDKEKEKKEFQLPDYINRETWDGFIEMRKKIKKPLTDLAITRLLNKLEKLKEQGENIEKVLEQSIINCWQDVYPVKNKEEKNNGNGKYKDIKTIRAEDL